MNSVLYLASAAGVRILLSRHDDEIRKSRLGGHLVAEFGPSDGAQSARRHLEHFAQGYRFAECLPLEQLARVPEISGGLIVVASMQSHRFR
jgi:hypothetical protein